MRGIENWHWDEDECGTGEPGFRVRRPKERAGNGGGARAAPPGPDETGPLPASAEELLAATETALRAQRGDWLPTVLSREEVHALPAAGADVTGLMLRLMYGAGIRKPVSCHTLRHSSATHLSESGVDIRSAQELLGHTSVETSRITTHVMTSRASGVRSPLD